MTVTLLQNAQLIDPEAGTIENGGLALKDGVISEVGQTISIEASDANVIDCGGKFLAPGLVDIGVKVCEPGERHKESFKSASLAAAAGGVTTLVTRPDTAPAIDTPETLSFTRRRAQEDSIVKVEAMAALTKGREGREMTEIGFLKDAGAVAFTDCDRVVQNTKVLTRASPMPVHWAPWLSVTPKNQAYRQVPPQARANLPACAGYPPSRRWPSVWA